MRILVTGGAGYIGSVVTDQLLASGHSVTVIDDLSKGHADAVSEKARFVRGEIADAELVGCVLRDDGIEAVIHLAASSLVGESVTDPAKYFRNNVVGGVSLLNSMVASGVKKIVFSSTAAVYGDAPARPIVESDVLKPTNPYGESKLVFENLMRWYREAYGLSYVSLRYFNAAGATALRGERHDPETHLIPIVLKAAAGEIDTVSIFGNDYATPDGTCIRDYIHVTDLARAHVLALADIDGRGEAFNLGCGGEGYSVMEVVKTAERVTGLDVPTEFAARRPGDPAILIASSEKIKAELGWKPEFQDLEAMIGSSWKWMNGRSSATS